MHGEHMEAEIREQPSALAAARFFECLGDLELRQPECVLLIARGSSDHAALYARYLIEVHLEIPAVLAAPSVWTRFGKRPRYRNALAVGISQSGAAPDVAEVLAAMREDGHQTLAITNTEGSRITQAAEHTLLLGVGEERSIAATKTYTASLLAMYELVRTLGGRLEGPVAPDEAWVEKARSSAQEGLGPVLRCSPLFALGRGYGFATAQETALKLMECALLPCKAYSTADFEHGPKALAGPGSTSVVFGEPASGEVVQAPEAPVSAELKPLWDIVFGQWLALLAARARGLDPDAARNLSKVTETR